jgi:hypothetical protein
MKKKLKSGDVSLEHKTCYFMGEKLLGTFKPICVLFLDSYETEIFLFKTQTACTAIILAVTTDNIFS